jgi:hypothetical protein
MASSGVARKKSSSSSSQGSGGCQSAGSTKSAGRVAKPSDKLNPKTIDPVCGYSIKINYTKVQRPKNIKFEILT